MSKNAPIPFPPIAGRVHEVCGAAACAFAAILSAGLKGPVIWCVEVWQKDVINPLGFVDFADPSRLLQVNAANTTDLLAVAEEALRDGAAPLVVLELSKPLDLTAGRRLQLAAKRGATTGLCIIPEGAGSNAAETRWRCSPVFDPSDSTLYQWEIIKNKKGTLGSWYVRWDDTSHHVHMVSPVAK